LGAVIRTWELAKSYHRRPALLGIDLEVPDNVVFGYLGPNGAGKTTTIRLLVGLLRPTSGRAELLGMDTVRDRDQMQRRIGYLPGEFVAYPDLTGEEYLRYLANLRGGVNWSIVEGMAKRFDLDLTGRIGALSHGNRQKVGIVQAFMHEPDVLILDEPTSGLDPLVQREFLELVRDTREQGRTVFLSSHILYEVEAVADAVAIIRAGRLVVVAPLERLELRDDGPGVVPGLRVRQLDLDRGGPVARDPLDGDALALERRLEILGHAIGLAGDVPLGLDAQHEVDSALQIEPEIDRALERVQIPHGHGDDDQHERDAQAEVLRHPSRPALPSHGRWRSGRTRA